jgi:polyphosphate glucokinase
MASSSPAKSSAASSRSSEAPPSPDGAPRTLAIDIGGSHIKASVLDRSGKFLTDRVRVATPVESPPDEVVEVIARLAGPLPAFERIAAGFPGAVKDGVVLTAPHLDHAGWAGFHLAEALGARLGKPARVLNDADMQGLAAIGGRGVEMVITLGTGFGTALCLNGRLAPHLEIGHLRFRKGQTFDEQLGNAARKRAGNKKWGRRVQRAIATLRMLANFDHLYVGGGNARHIAFELPPDVTIVSNDDGIEGGVAAWRD